MEELETARSNVDNSLSRICGISLKEFSHEGPTVGSSSNDVLLVP